MKVVGGDDGIYSSGTVILGWCTPTDSIYASSYYINGSIYVKPGQTFVDDDGNVYTGGPLDRSALAGKTLRPYVGTLVPYIDEHGEERNCLYYTALTNAAGDATYGTAGEEAWYVVTNDVSIGGTLRFNGSTNHLIVCDGATLSVTNTSDDAIQSAGSLSIYGQADSVGTLAADGSSYGIYANGDLIVNGGALNITGGGNGIYADSIVLGWNTFSDSITVSGYDGPVSVRPGLSFTDGTATYTGGPLDTDVLAGKTLRPYVVTISYIDANGEERQCYPYTVITNAAGDVTYGTAGAEAWYVVTNDVSIGGTLQFKDSYSHLIVCDGVTLAVTNTSGDAIRSYGSLSIYGQADGTGTLDLKGGDDAIQTKGFTINGGIVNANGRNGIYLSSGTATINGGVVNAIGTSYGIYSSGSVTLGWRMPTDSIYVNRYNYSGSRNIYVKPGQTFVDDDGNIYTDGPLDADNLAGKTLRPYVGTLVPYIDENGEERRCPYYTVLTNAAGGVTYGASDAEAWYVVTNDVVIGGMLCFNDSHAHLILCDGASFAVTNTSGNAIYSAGSLSFYGQANGSGPLAVDGNSYGIYANGDLSINGGTVTATGNNCGIRAGDIVLGWMKSTDSIYASGYDGTVSVKAGQTLTDGTDTYTGDSLDTDVLAGKTLRPYVLIIPYINANGEERECVKYTVLTNAASGDTYGTASKEAWYVVTNDVSLGGTLRFNGSTNHLIVCDGVTLAITNTSGDAIHSYGSLSIYGQAAGTGTLDLKGGDDGIETKGLTINGGIVNVNSKYGIYLSSGTFATLTDTLTVNGGVMNAIGTSYGIFCSCSVTLGWRTPTDSIYVSSYNNSSSRNIYVKLGQTLIDDDGNIYTGNGSPLDADDLAGKTLRPSIPTPTFNDPQGNEIQDSGVIAWLSDNGFTQADIDGLGNDAAATDKLYACFLLNCDFTAQDAGGALSITGIAVTNGVVSITVQLERKAPMGSIIGCLYFYGASDLAAGFSRSPIAKASISFGAGDSTFATAPTTDSVTQSVTATFDVSVVNEKFFKAVIEVSR